jgi:hypothetical protein
LFGAYLLILTIDCSGLYYFALTLFNQMNPHRSHPLKCYITNGRKTEVTEKERENRLEHGYKNKSANITPLFLDLFSDRRFHFVFMFLNSVCN